MIGKIFNNRYKIIEKLGSGGTSIVYRGQDLLLNRMVTVKILREEYASNADFVRRFRHEAQAVASLSHSNIVSVYDVGSEDNMQYIVMEFVEGESLKDYIRLKGTLPVSEACNIISQILAGVQHAHEHGIIHRDIKSHNILLSKDGRAKVTDFGIAVGMSDVTLTYNTSSRIMGSVHYISPEQVQGKSVTEKSDIYSAGVIFYEMLTGRLPFLGETPISIAMQHVQGELIPPHQLNPNISMGLSYVVMRAMRKNPETRYASAKEMAEAVRAAYEGLDSTASAAAFTKDEELKNVVKTSKPQVEINEDESSGKGGIKLNGKRIAILAGAAAALILLVWLVAHLVGGGETTEVPYVVGSTYEEAQKIMSEAGLEVEPTYVNSDQAAGLVLAQAVAEGTKVSKGRVIGLTVSAGAETLEMPDLEGATRKIAELTLRNKGFTNITYVEQYDSKVPKDQVILQSPEAGTKIAADTPIELIISLGEEPESFSMPDLRGFTVSEASTVIDQYGLILTETKYAESTEYVEGAICDQSISPHTNTKTGASLTLTVSNGPGPQQELTKTVSWTVPDDEQYHNVVVKVADERNTREVYNEVLGPGSFMQTTVTYYGSGTVTILVDDVVVSTEALS